MRRKHINFRLNNRGMALLTVMLVMLVLSILTTGVIVISVANFDQTSTTVDHSEAYYVAEAGINYQVSILETTVQTMLTEKKTTKQILDWIDSWATGTSFNHTLANVNGALSVFSASADRNGNAIDITSTGSVGGASRTLTKKVRISGLIIDKAILTSGLLNINKTDIFLAGPIETYGPVQTLTSTAGSVLINPLAEVGEISIPTPVYPLTYKEVISVCNPPVNTTMICSTKAGPYTVKYDDSISILPPVILPVQPAYSKTNDLLKPKPLKITSGSKSQSLIDSTGIVRINSNSVYQGYTYTLATSNSPKKVFYVPDFILTGTVTNFAIDIGSNDIVIIADKFTLGGSFKIIGSGTLTVFVPLSGFTLNCSTVCGVKGNTNPLVSDQFRMVITGSETSTLNLSNNTGDIYMTLFTNMSVNLSMNGNGSFNGYMLIGGDPAINKTLDFGGTSGSNALIYAPYANVNITGNVALNGSIIAKTYTNANSNSTEVTYDPAFSSPPFSFLNPFANLQFDPTIED